MALSFVYDVIRTDGTGYKSFRNQKKAEAYARTLKDTPADKIQITRTGKAFAPYVYYV